MTSKTLFSLIAALLLLSAPGFVTSAKGQESGSSDAKSGSKINALMICGGCCHDYNNQKRIISEGLNQRIDRPIDWTILEYGSKRDVKADIYQKADWIKGFDIVVHNECFGGITDGDFVEGIVKGHVDQGVPAIVVHCSMHSYRNAPTADTWRAFLGVTSKRHEKSKHPLVVKTTEAGADHAIMKSVDGQWTTPNGELYIIEKVWPETTVLAKVFSEETEKEEPVIWTNTYKGVKVFGISLGHHNETMEDPTWQSIVAQGWRWSLNK